MSWLSTIWTKLKEYKRELMLVGGSVLLTTVIVAVLPSMWADTPQDHGVVAEWNDTILRLGIEPVFPPEEDIYVGDLFALITADHRQERVNAPVGPLLNRAIKLDHIDMTRDLNQVYKILPIFPETAKRPDGSPDPGLQKDNPNGLFAEHPPRGYLGIAAFPGFTIKNSRNAAAGLSAFGYGLFGGARQDNELVKVVIPAAETYGVPSAIAVGKLAIYCGDPFTKVYCTDATLRQHLSFVNPIVLLKSTDEKTGKPRYVVDVEIALVNRVYMTRSIEQTRRIGQGTAAKVEALSEVASRLKQGTRLPPKSDGQASPPAGVDDAAKPPDPDAASGSVQKQTQDILDRLDAAVPGGLLSTVTGSDSEYELKQTFQRPIVIGYRAVRTSFPDNLDQPRFVKTNQDVPQ